MTLTGPGGVGKTRLALQVAERLRDAFPDGLFFIGLAPVSDSGLVLGTIGQVLGLRDIGAMPVLEVLKTFVSQRRLLLILDNFEQVIQAAPLVGELLAAGRNIRMLVGSREPLLLRDEHEFAVSPLALPSPGHLPALAELGPIRPSHCSSTAPPRSTPSSHSTRTTPRQ